MKQFIAYSGTHGTGKTLSAGSLFTATKVAFPSASVCLLVDLEAYCPFPLNKDATESTQKWLFTNQIQQELMAKERFDIVITDRTLVDIIAYTYVAGFEDLAMGMTAMAHCHISHYQEINIKQVKHNQYCYSDGIRETTDDDFRNDVEASLIESYKGFVDSGMIKGDLFYV